MNLDNLLKVYQDAYLASSEREYVLREGMSAKLQEAYEWGYSDGQNNPNGYSSKEDRDQCVISLMSPPAERGED